MFAGPVRYHQAAVSTFEVDLAGLLQVFGGHLYSDRRVFVRELVQNAADAIVLRREAEPGHRGAITVRAGRDAVVFEDDGAGLDREAIASALGKIGYSTKRGGAPQGTAGRFGIGLLSGFLVADQIELTTRAAGGEALRWAGRTDGTWSIEPAARDAVGTTVKLALAPAHAALGGAAELRAMLLRFARYLPIPLVLAEPEGHETAISEPAPWTGGDPLAAARALSGAEPLAALQIDHRDLRGVLWIHRDRANTEGGRVALYQHGLLVEHAARDLLPNWAGFITGAIESTALSPTASRETYVRDAAADATASVLRDRVIDWLSGLPHQVDVFERVIALHATHLRGACAGARELLEAIGDRIPMETSHGEIDLATLRAVSGERAFRMADTSQAFAHVAPLAIAQGVPVINAVYLHDRAFVEAWARHRGVALEPLDVTSLEVFLRPAPDKAARFAAVLDAARALLEPLDVEAEIGRFEPTSIPAFLLTEPTAIHERARAMVRAGGSSLTRDLLRALPVASTERGTRFVLNVDNSLVAGLPDVADRDVAARVIRLLYAQAVMTIRRTVSRDEARVFSDDLAGLINRVVGVADRTGSPQVN